MFRPTSSWACWVPPTRICAHSRRFWRPISTRAATRITLSGEPADVALAERVISELIAIVASGQPLTPEAVRHSVAMLTGTEGESPAEVLTLDILSRRGKTIRPKTLNQKRYVDAIDAHTIVFGIGPAGTGKTYLAMAKAVARAADQAGQPDHPDPSRGGSR